jgi:integrase
MATLYKRNGTYYTDFSLPDGSRKRISLRTDKKSVAVERLAEAELVARTPKEVGVTLGDAFSEMFLTKRAATREAYQWRAQAVVRYFGHDFQIADLTREAVQGYLRQRREQIGPNTLHKETVALRQALKEAKKHGRFLGNAHDLVPAINPEYTPRRRWLTTQEFSQLLEAAPQKHKSWLWLQVYLGVNKSECGRLTWAHVNFAHGSVHVPGTKRTARDRVVPLHPELRAFLEQLKASGDVLVHQWPRVNWWLRQNCLKLGIVHVSTNDLRRTFASWLKQAGVDSLAVAHLLGHSSTTMVERVYGRLSEATYKEAVSHLPEVTSWHKNDTK